MRFFYLIHWTLLIASFCFFHAIECIIGGVKVTTSDFRNHYSYTVGITAERPFKGKRAIKFCTGGILSDSMIITAAHCFVEKGEKKIADLTKVVIRAKTILNKGRINLIRRRAEKIFVLQSYIDKSDAARVAQDDVAIVKLDRSLDLSKNKLQKLQLPKTLDVDNPNAKETVVTGFGAYKIVNHEPEMDHKLRSLDIKIKKIKNRNDYLEQIHIRGTPKDAYAGYPRGFCAGDSGGPLVILNGQTPQLIGIVSANDDECNDITMPGYYMRVYAFLYDFINPIMVNERPLADTAIAIKEFGAHCQI